MELLKPLADRELLVGTRHSALLPDLCKVLWPVRPSTTSTACTASPWCYPSFCTSVLVSLFGGLSRGKRREVKHLENNLFFYQNFHFKLQLLSFLMWKLIREKQLNAAFFSFYPSIKSFFKEGCSVQTSFF